MSNIDHSSVVAVILVNWNGWRDTLSALESLRRSTYAAWRLIIVDNASTDDSRVHLSDLGDRVTLIASAVNTGFAGGVNLGVRAALAQGCGYVFLLNNDATVRPETLCALVTASQRAAHRAALGAIVRYQATGELQYFGSTLGDDHGDPQWFRSPRDLWRLKLEFIEVDFIFGAALFSPAVLFETVGLMDERFFLTYEETDWCYRARAAGFSCFVVPAAVVDHVGSASLGDSSSPMQAYFLQRNDLLFKDKHARPVQRWRSVVESLRRLKRRVEQPEFGLTDPTTQALIIGLGDYVRRRFGDCPPRVRALAAQARAAAADCTRS